MCDMVRTPKKKDYLLSFTHTRYSPYIQIIRSSEGTQEDTLIILRIQSYFNATIYMNQDPDEFRLHVLPIELHIEFAWTANFSWQSLSLRRLLLLLLLHFPSFFHLIALP